MQNRSRYDNDFVIPLVIIAGLLFASTVLGFSHFLGVNFITGLMVCGRLAGLILLVIISLKLGEDFEMIGFGNVWPIVIALFWCCFWPVLDFHASFQRPSFLKDDYPVIWWAAWYTKWGVMSAIIISGYVAKIVFQKDY